MAGKKILVIDDSPLVRKLAEVSLQEAGYEVYTASDGEEGLKIAEEVKPDLILVDFIMPKMTGSQFCKLIRENETFKDVPIILITGKGETVGQTFIEKYGILDYFIKPFKSEELIEKINQILSKAPETVEVPQEEVAETTQKEVTELLSEETVELPQEEVYAFNLEPSEIKLPEMETKPPEPEIKLPEPEIKLPEPEINFPEPEIKLPEMEIKETEEILSFEEKEPEQSELQIPEFETEPEIKQIKPEKEIPEEKSTQFDLTSLEKLIEDKLNSFSEKFTSSFDSLIEGLLKKYGLIKDSSFILSGNLNFFSLPEVFDLINSKRLNGIFSVYGRGIVYEFLFIGGQLIYGISNLQKQKIGFKLLNELSQEEIRSVTIEAITSLIETKSENFIFERKDFSEDLLNKTGYNPSELLKEALKMI